MPGTITTGTILSGRYEIIRFLGRGAFAETYLAKDRQMPFEMECVVKRLKPQATDSETLQAARVLFDREAQVLYQLGNHEQIPRLLAHFQENQEFYLLEDFVDGEDLEKKFAASQPWTETQVIDLLKQVLGILAFVHQHNVIHRDIKPSNLIQRQGDGKIVLLDFGAVKQVHTQVVTAGGHTSFVFSVGTSGYMPNEQLGRKPRYSSDIYALGMTAIHALIGKSPDQLEDLEDPETGEIVWRLYAQQVNHRLAAILDKMVRSHFRDRYQTVEEVLEDLQLIPLEEVESEAQPEVTTLEAEPQPQPAQRVRGWQKSLSKLKTVIGQWQISLKPRYLWIVLAALGVTVVAYQIVSSTVCERKPNVCIEEGIKLNASGEYKKALAKFQRIPTDKLDKPQATEALLGKGVALYFLGRYEEALTVLEKAGQLNPNHVLAWEGQGRSLYYLERYEEAVNALNKALNLNPNNSSLWSLRAEALAELERFDEAFNSLVQATSVNPVDPAIWKSRGVVQYIQGHYSEALYAFEEAIEIFKSNYENLKNDPDYTQAYADAFFIKGKSLEELRRYEEAIAAYDKVIELKPDFQEAKEARQQAIEKQGR